MTDAKWHELGAIDELSKRPLAQIRVEGKPIALTFKDGMFSAISGACNHVGGPLGEGTLEGDYVVCPWHQYKFNCRTGEGEPGFEGDRVPSYETKIDGGKVWINLVEQTKRNKISHKPHSLLREIIRADGPARVAGISTTMMDNRYPRYSGSEALLEHALDFAKAEGADTRLIRLRDLHFRPCEGYYSKAAPACTWPCTLTQFDHKDELDQIYEAFVHWADVILLATPIRWGAASALYYKMVERLNCIQNQITTHNKVLIRNKVASFIIVGGQDNVQAVAGQLLGFFGEIGFVFPQFPFIAHSRGWSAEDMERNVSVLKTSQELREGADDLVRRALDLSESILAGKSSREKWSRGGRKAHHGH